MTDGTRTIASASFAGAMEPALPRPLVLRLRSLPARDMRLGNLIGRGKVASFEIEGREARVEVDVAQVMPDVRDGTAVSFRTGQGMLNLRPAAALQRLLTGIELPSPDSGVDDRVREWALVTAMARLPEEWRRLFGLEEMVNGLSAPEEATLALRVHVEGLGLTLGAAVSGSVDVLERVFAAPCWSAKEPVRPELVEALPVRRPVEIGRSIIGMHQFKRIGIGDLILFDSHAFGADGEGTLWIGTVGMRGRLLAEAPGLQFEFDGWCKRRDTGPAADGLAAHDTAHSSTYNATDDTGNDMEDDFDDELEHELDGEDHQEHDEDHDDEYGDDDDHEGDHGHDDDGQEAHGEEDRDAADHLAAAPLDDLPLTLVFEIGTLDTRLAELRELAEGSVIELGRATPPTVVIRCNGVEAGRGELVEVEGRLAVQVADLRVRHGL
jgi:type III secretion protein Q